MDTAVFVELLVNSGALRFGSFVTKSGRQSPYFFNSGSLCTGRDLSILAGMYADLICESFSPDQHILFGPAYKGIPLVSVVAETLYRKKGMNVPMTYNRKEVKDHGEGGELIGHQFKPVDRIIIVEDVLTGGTSVRESARIISRCGASLAGIVVGIDRQEKGQGSLSAREEIERDYGVPVLSLLNLDAIISVLSRSGPDGKRWLDQASLASIREYRQSWGAGDGSIGR